MRRVWLFFFFFVTQVWMYRRITSYVMWNLLSKKDFLLFGNYETHAMIENQLRISLRNAILR